MARSRAGGQRGATARPQCHHCSPGPAGPPPVLQPPGAGVPTQLLQQPPPSLPFLSCAHQALGEVFFFSCPHTSLALPSGADNSPSHQHQHQLPGGPWSIDAVCRARGGTTSRHACQGTWAACAAGGGMCVCAGALDGIDVPRLRGLPPLPAAGCVTSQRRDLPARVWRGAKAVNKPAAAWGTAALRGCVALGTTQVGVIN